MISSKVLGERILSLYDNLASCTICPRKCKVNRLINELGYCHIGHNAIVSNYGPHFGEERELVGSGGSGTIFFAGCNLKCVFCQNYSISQSYEGEEMPSEDIAEIILKLQETGCHNINFVSPTHVAPQILKAIFLAKKSGLKIPLVYNSGGYDSLETLRQLDGVIDIYMPDAKYADEDIAKKYSDADDYPSIMKVALKEMHRQVGNFVINKRGIGIRGLLVRHLVLPGGLAGTEEILKFIAKEISKDTYVNIMDQYRPTHNADDYKELARPLDFAEYQQALECARRLGLHRGF